MFSLWATAGARPSGTLTIFSAAKPSAWASLATTTTRPGVQEKSSMQKFPPHRTSSTVIFIGSAGNSVIFQSTKTRSQQLYHVTSCVLVPKFWVFWGLICTMAQHMCGCGSCRRKTRWKFSPVGTRTRRPTSWKLHADNRAKLHDYFGTKLRRWNCCVVRLEVSSVLRQIDCFVGTFFSHIFTKSM